MESRITRQTTACNVLNGLRWDVMLDKYGEDRPISEMEIANRYQVSRSSVRAAFLELERDGLLEILPNGRKCLKAITQQYIEDLCQTRSLLECEAARRIIHQESNDFSELLRIVAQLYSAVEDKEDSREKHSLLLAELNTKFHVELFHIAGNCMLTQCYKNIEPMLSTINQFNATLNRNTHEHGYYTSHNEIATRLMARDEGVIEYIRYHTVDATMKDNLAAIREQKELLLSKGE